MRAYPHSTLTLCLFSLLVGCDGTIEAKPTGPDVSADMMLADAKQDAQEMTKTPPVDQGRPDQGPPDQGMDQGQPPQDQQPDLRVEDAPPDMPPMIGSEGCVSGQGLAEGEHTFMLEGRSRKYVLRLPQGYSKARAWPLVFALHGNGGDTGYWDGSSGGRNIREALKDDAVLIIAQAIDKQWRDYNMPQNTWPERIESELLYFDTLINEAKRELCINDKAIFSMGFSGGGSFSGVLGCRRTDIRAIAVGGSVIYFDPDQCVGRPAAWITIGTMELAAGREAYRDYWRDRASCSSTSAPTTPSPCIAYDSCDAQTPVHYCQHPDGHIWPSFGAQAMWAFFKQFVPPAP